MSASRATVERARGGPRTPRQSYNELELAAGIGLVAVLIVCVLYILERVI